MIWLPVNNAQWALLDSAFSIIWNQLAMNQKWLFSFSSGELSELSTRFHKMYKKQNKNE